MNVEQIEGLPYTLLQDDTTHVLDLIGQKKLDYDHLFVNYGNAEILSVYGCDGIPYMYKNLDLIFINEPLIKVLKVDNKFVGFFAYHDYRFNYIAKTVAQLRAKLAKDLKANNIKYYYINVMELNA